MAGLMTKHPFHIVDYRPWPLTGSVGRICIVAGIAAYTHKFDTTMLYVGLALILATIGQ